LEFTTTTASAVIPKLIIIFAEFGNPHEIRSDNGPPYNSHEFAEFLKQRNILHIKTVPASPNCNGQCENLNKVFNKVIRIAKLEARPWRTVLQEALLNYRTTPHSSTGFPPATLMFNRSIRGVLPAIVPATEINITQMYAEASRNDAESKQIMKIYADERRHAKVHSFQKGDRVRVIQAKRNKLDTKFDGEILIIESVNGVLIVAHRPSNNTLVTRHASQFTLVKTTNQAPKRITVDQQQPKQTGVKLGNATAFFVPEIEQPEVAELPTPEDTPAIEFMNPLEEQEIFEDVFEDVQTHIPPAPPIEQFLQAEGTRARVQTKKQAKLSSQITKQIKHMANIKSSENYKKEHPSRKLTGETQQAMQ